MLEKINNKVFVYFCLNPHSQIHIRELARQLKISAPTCIELIKPLVKLNLLKKKSVGKSIVISANLSERYIYYKKWINVFLLLDSGLVGKISEKNPETLILFGSYARGEDNERSDIDLALDIPVTENLSKYEKILNRKIQLHKLSKDMPETLVDNIRQGILLTGVMI